MKPLHTTYRYFDKTIKWSFDFEDQNIPAGVDFSYLLGFFPIEAPYISNIKIDENYREYINNVLPHIKWISPQPFSNSLGLAPFWYYQSLPEDHYHELSSKKNWFAFLERLKILKHSVHILKNIDDLKLILEIQKNENKSWLIKSFQGFSGKSHFVLNSKKWKEAKIQEQVSHWIFPLIAEEYFSRETDFSIFISPYKNFELIYKNEVDQHFQYRGTLIERSVMNHIPDFLKNYHVEDQEILNFAKNFDSIKKNLANYVREVSSSVIWGGSMDSFIYREEDKKQNFIHPGCEFNFRKTMGLVSYLIWKYVANSCAKMKLVFLPRKNPFSLIHGPDDYYQESMKRFTQENLLMLTPYGVSPKIEIEMQIN
ncbi:MAG: hypothetical protein QE271_01150 [Bacteriovoracaceae bacterium]|nr:hypothetical protein [Bacteriovoracaceae bacterium]